jgi:cytochrome P450
MMCVVIVVTVNVGYDTSSVMLTYTLYLIARHKPIQQKLHEEVERVQTTPTQENNQQTRDANGICC